MPNSKVCNWCGGALTVPGTSGQFPTCLDCGRTVDAPIDAPRVSLVGGARQDANSGIPSPAKEVAREQASQKPEWVKTLVDFLLIFLTISWFVLDGLVGHYVGVFPRILIASSFLSLGAFLARASHFADAGNSLFDPENWRK
jgi:hypothetical protein